MTRDHQTLWSGLALVLSVTTGCGQNAAEEIALTEDAGVPAVILDGGGGIEVSPDGADLCPVGVCNYQTRQGCDQGMACRPAIAGEGDARTLEPGCQEAGPGVPGDSCSSWLDCGAGTLCAEGTCRQLCCGGDWASCPAGNSCIRELMVPVGTAIKDAQVGLCFPVNNCVLGDPDSCALRPDAECLIADPTGAVACIPPGDSELGDPCDPGDPCRADQVCVGKRCVQLCRATEPGPEEPRPCPDAESCVHFDRDPAGWGECTPYAVN